MLVRFIERARADRSGPIYMAGESAHLSDVVALELIERRVAVAIDEVEETRPVGISTADVVGVTVVDGAPTDKMQRRQGAVRK